MKPLALTTVLGLAALVAACGQETATHEAATENMDTMMGNMSGDMGNMAVPAETKMAKGTGTVTAIDKAAGTITLDHGPIPEVNWPAMTMAFKARPEVLDSVKIGEKVSFELALKGDAGEVTAINRE